jgi:hypothetical protein
MGKYVFNKTLDVIIIRIKQTISIDVKDEKVRIQISDPFYSTKSVFDTSSTFGEQGELQSKLGLDMANEEWDKLISNLETYLKQDTSW